MICKNEKTGKWEVRTYYKNYKGERKQKTKRGFKTKREAQDWERHFKLQDHQDMNMTLEDFYELYKRDVVTRLGQIPGNKKLLLLKRKLFPIWGKEKLMN